MFNYSLSFIKTIFSRKFIVHCARILLYNKWYKDLNTGLYKDLDTNFEQAFYLCNCAFSHNELIAMLKDGDILHKQIAALKFDYVKNDVDAKALVSNLTGCDGKIREAVAHRIYNIILSDINSRGFFANLFPKVFADATIDINANICRYVVDSVKFLYEYENFSQNYVSLILEYSKQALDTLDKFIYKDKKYVINKQLFKLYWCLETLKNFYMLADGVELFNILKRASRVEEYTIREKVAQIVVLSDDYKEISAILKNDSNYYVKSVFLNH